MATRTHKYPRNRRSGSRPQHYAPSHYTEEPEADTSPEEDEMTPYRQLIGAVLKQTLEDITKPKSHQWHEGHRQHSFILVTDAWGDLSLFCDWLNADAAQVQRALYANLTTAGYGEYLPSTAVGTMPSTA